MIWLGFGLLRTMALLPYRPMMATGRWVGRTGLRLAVARRRIVKSNLRLCFPEFSDEERARLQKRHAEAVGMALMDVAIAWWWHDERLYRWVEIHGREHIEAATARGRGIIFLTAHFTSLEISGRLLKDIFPSLPIYRPDKNPLIEWLMVRHRERHVEHVIPRRNVRTILRTLRNGKGVWFAPDQNFRGKGHLFAPFFGIPASSNPSLGRFVEMTGAAVIPFVVIRKPRGGYHLIIENALSDQLAHDERAGAVRYNEIVERWARQAPAQYNWLHRRFKTRPPGEAFLYD